MNTTHLRVSFPELIQVQWKSRTGGQEKSFNLFTSNWSEEEQRTCEANAADENSSFIFTVCVKLVPLYHFKLAYIVVYMAVEEVFETHF